MKKFLIPLIILVVVAFGLYNWAVGFNNTAVEHEANAKTAWADVESSYQRRNDLYSTVISTVQGASDFERGTLKDVIEARSKATSVTIDPSNITPEQLAKFQQAQTGLQGAFNKLMVVVERYPELTATQTYKDFIAQQEGTENRINVARDRFNDAVNTYDIFTTKFPGKILANLFGFKEMARYKSDPGSEKVPELDFNNNKD